MLKKFLASGLIAIVLIAGSVSVYNVVFTQAAEGQVEVVAVLDGAEASPLPNSGLGVSDANVTSAQAMQTSNATSAISPESEIPFQADSNVLSDGSTSGQTNQSGNQGEQSQGQGQRRGQVEARGQGGNRGQVAGSGNNQAAPQNGFQGWVTLQGMVSDYLAPNFTLLLVDGQTVQAQLGNINFIESLGLSLQAGETVTVLGFYDPEGGFAVGQITLQSTGESFILRSDFGQPAWSGGANR